MADSRKVQGISTKYFMCINQRYYVIYLQNMKFMWLIVWPGGAYTDDTYTTKPESRSHIRIHFMNHDYIGSFWQCQMSQKPRHSANIFEWEMKLGIPGCPKSYHLIYLFEALNWITFYENFNFFAFKKFFKKKTTTNTHMTIIAAFILKKIQHYLFTF